MGKQNGTDLDGYARVRVCVSVCAMQDYIFGPVKSVREIGLWVIRRTCLI
jgi:hypothetical protein